MKRFQPNLTVWPELQRLLEEAVSRDVSEEELREQRISFAFGNAPAEASLITKESVKRAARYTRLR